MDVAEGQRALHRGRCRWDLSSEDQNTTALLPESLSQETFLCDGITMNEKKKSPILRFLIGKYLERANIPGLQ